MANNCTAIVEVNGKDIQDDYWNLTIMSKQFVGKDASGLRWFDCNILCSHHKDISRLAGRNSSARKGLKLLITDNIDGVYEHACENNEYESEYKEDESGDQAQENEEMDADESDIEEVLVDDEYREDESENAAQEMDKGEDSDIEEILVDEREKSFKGFSGDYGPYYPNFTSIMLFCGSQSIWYVHHCNTMFCNAQSTIFRDRMTINSDVHPLTFVDNNPCTHFLHVCSCLCTAKQHDITKRVLYIC